jgi:hypothetical protein
MIDDEIEDDPELEDAYVVANLISASNALVARMPIEAVLHPKVNDLGVSLRAAVLTDLFAKEPGQGVGGKWLKAIAEICDRDDITLYTDAACDRSKAFFLAHGFECTKNMPHMLVRWPPPSPALLAAMAQDADHD